MTFPSGPVDGGQWHVQDKPVGFWLGASIANTMLCCGPFGVVGIVFSALAMSARTGATGTRSIGTSARREASPWPGFAIGAVVVAIALALASVDSPGDSTYDY